MAVTLGDIIRITLCQRIASQTACNVFAYVVDELTGSVTLEDIINQFVAEILDKLNAIQTAAITNVSVTAENLTDGLSFFELGLSGTGDIAETPVAVMNALGVKYLRTDKTTRNGFKRFAGVAYSKQLNQNVWKSDDIPINTLVTQLGLPFSAGVLPNESVIYPIILGRNALGQPDLTRYQKVSNTALQVQVTTQNSRKIGVGE